MGANNADAAWHFGWRRRSGNITGTHAMHAVSPLHQSSNSTAVSVKGPASRLLGEVETIGSLCRLHGDPCLPSPSSFHAVTGKVLCGDKSEGHCRSDGNAGGGIGATHNARHIVSYRI
jgi:hypothetical protein